MVEHELNLWCRFFRPRRTFYVAERFFALAVDERSAGPCVMKVRSCSINVDWSCLLVCVRYCNFQKYSWKLGPPTVVLGRDSRRSPEGKGVN